MILGEYVNWGMSMRRRAHSALWALAIALQGLAVPAVAHAQKLVFVARHAERADEPARNLEDPPLSAAGQARAARLSAMLADAGVRAIFVTQYKRTQQTAGPLAARLKITPQVMPVSVDALVQELKREHPKDVVLIVAHSTTIPGIIKGLGGSDVKLDEKDYTSLFVVAPATGGVSRIRY
jgi:broad specificity phosphatase PhoE